MTISSDLLEETSLSGVTFTLPHNALASRGIAAAVTALMLSCVLYGALGPVVTPLTMLLSMFTCTFMLGAVLSRFFPQQLRLLIAPDQVCVTGYVGWFGPKREIRMPIKGLQLARKQSTGNAGVPYFTLTMGTPHHPPVRFPMTRFFEADLMRMMTVVAEHQAQAASRTGEGQHEVPAALQGLQEQSATR